MDSSRTVGNGFTYQEKLSSSKLTSVLEAVAGEYALVINGHSLVRAVILNWAVPPESASFRMAFMSYLAVTSLISAEVAIFKGTKVLRLPGVCWEDCTSLISLCVPGPCIGGRHGAGVSRDSMCLQSCHLLPGYPLAEGTSSGTG